MGTKGSFRGICCSVHGFDEQRGKKEGFPRENRWEKGNPALKTPGFSGRGIQETEPFPNPVIPDFPAFLQVVTNIPGL